MARIYVASLSDYNAGLLLGEWIDLDSKDADDVHDEIAAMLRTSKHPNVTICCTGCDGSGDICADPAMSIDCPNCKGTGEVPSAEEWSIHDYDDCPNMGENPSIEDLIEQVELLDKHGDAWRAYIEWRHVNDVSEDDFDNTYAGEASSEEAWLEEYMENAGTLDEMPAHLRNYFDDAAYLRDMKMGGDVNFEYVNGTTYAFWNL